jgi:ribonucleoside-diphosphate reductase beta chain
MEFLLDPKNKRYNIQPRLCEDIYQAYVKHRSLFWIPEEINLIKDLNDWINKLSDDEREYIKKVLAFFATSDVIINENIELDSDDVTVLEYKFYLHDKEAREDIHTLMYHRLLNTYIKDEEERKYLFASVETIPTIKKKIDWFKKYFNKTFAHRRVSSAITEGIFFSGSFCSIFWLKSRKLMPGLCDSNEAISREEGIHCEVECMIYNNYVVNKLPDEEVEEMIKEAVEIEIEFVNYILPSSLIGINANAMSEYIKFVANRLSIMLLNKKIYEAELSLECMALISQITITNFFEHKPTAYAKFIDNDEEIVIDEDF